MPFMSSTRAGSTTTLPAQVLKRMGTRMEAPNMAKRCWRLRGMPFRIGTFSSTWMISLCGVAAIPSPFS